MAESNSFPGDLAECHRLMAQQQALFAAMELRHAEETQRRSDVEQVLNRTATDLDQLREEHRKALDELFPKFGISFSDKFLSFQEIFNRAAPVVLEIGSGMGETTAAIAQEHPETDYIAIEAVLGQEVYAAVFEGKPAKQALADAEATVGQAIRARIEGRGVRRKVLV